jgi:hypothetical protein
MDKIAWALAGHSADSAKLADLHRLLDGRVRWFTPTIASLRALSGSRSREYGDMLRRPEVAYMDSGSIAWWRSLHREGDRPADASPFYQFQIAVLKELKTLGNLFLLGTDTPNPLMVPGFSVHDELQALVRDAGFTSYEALLAATRNVGTFLADSTIGVVRLWRRSSPICSSAACPRCACRSFRPSTNRPPHDAQEKTMPRPATRRNFLVTSAALTTGSLFGGCAGPTPATPARR